MLLLLINQILGHIDTLGEAIGEVQVEIERRLTPFEELLALLQTIPGIKPIAAATMVGEIGTGVSRFPTAGGKVEPTGKSFTVPVASCFVLRVAGGKVAEYVGHIDFSACTRRWALCRPSRAPSADARIALVRALVARLLTRNGVGLAFEDAGTGGPPLLLVHGWACNRSYLRPQLEHFCRERRVVAVDLRGHGASDAPAQQYGMATFADDLEWLCSQLEIVHPVIVGHSMGGVVALEAVARYPEFAAGVVALDAPMVLPPGRLAQLRAVGEGFSASDFVNAVRRFVEGMFLPTDDPSLRSRIVEAMSGRPQHVLRSSWTGLFGCPSASAATARPTPVPVLAIASAGGHMADLNRLAELSPLLVTGQTVGAGHFHQLVVPDQVNAMIDRFLKITQIERNR